MPRYSVVSIGLCWLLFLPFSAHAQGPAAPYPVQVIENLSYYGEGHALESDLTRLNLVLPEGVERPPLLLWVGGGAWAYVDRQQEMNLCRRFAEQGLAVASVGHRLSPQLLRGEKSGEGVQHPAHAQDVARALAWLYAHAAEYGYAPDQIFVGGFSSGAHLTTLLAMDGQYLRAEGLSPTLIKGLIPVGGGYDIPAYREILVGADMAFDRTHFQAVFGPDPSQYRDASPIAYLDSLRTPMLLVSERTTHVYSEGFEHALREAGYEAFEALNIHTHTHGSLWRNLGDEKPSPYRDYFLGFIWRQVGEQPEN